MTEAVKRLCDYVFTHTDIIRIYAEPFSFNIGSCRVLEKKVFSAMVYSAATQLKTVKSLI